MAEQDTGQERTEQATPKRREEAREKGQVAKSREIASTAVLLGVLILFYFNAKTYLNQLEKLLGWGLSQPAYRTFNQEKFYYLFHFYVYESFLLLLPLMILVVVLAILGNVIQVGFLISATSIEPKWSKIDPISGAKRLFSLKALVELIKTIIKMTVVGFVAYLVMMYAKEDLLVLVDQSPRQILHFIGEQSFKILAAVSVILIFLSLFDYLYQRWEFEESIKMTKEEVKREIKNTEGDPLIKARIRRIQRELAKKRMMAAVPKADVVITNPEHLAIALQYDQRKMAAPQVTAMGAGLIALKIREIAQENGVPLVENPPVAQLLFRTAALGRSIPEELYRAVAEILAYVYRLRRPEGRGEVLS
jgi:flagellar biosynthetic protein FlhB